MTTAAEVASRALRRILVEADEASLETTEYDDFYSAMNDYMAALEADDINLGYTAVSAGTDVLTVPAGAIRGMVANLAIEVSPDYGGNVTPELVKQAKEGMETMLKLGMHGIEARYPTTLPIGSGNRGNSGTGYDFNFYGQQARGLMSIAAPVSQSVAVSSTVRSKIAGPWGVEAIKGLAGDITGVLRNISGSDVEVEVDLTMNVDGNSAYKFGVINGSGTEGLITNATVLASGVAQDITLTGTMTLSPGEWIYVYTLNTGATDPDTLTVNEAQLKVI